MKLYFSPGACSLAPHIVCEELGLNYEAIQVDLKNHKLKNSGEDYYQVNPKGYVPFIDDNGFKLSEDAVILQYLASLKPEAKLFPRGGQEEWQARELLHYLGTEIHKGFGPIFHGPHIITSEEGRRELKTAAEKKLIERFGYLAQQIKSKDYLLGSFSVADPYLFTLLRWTAMTSFKVNQWPELAAFNERMLTRAAVQKTLKAEGLH